MEKVRIGVLVSGGGTNLQSIIDAIEQDTINGEIAVVISDRENAYALKRAENHGIKGIFLNKKDFPGKKAYNEALRRELEAAGAELVVLAGFLTILEPELVKAFEGRMINIHPSLIPSFCGAGFYGEKVHQAAIEYGVKLSGATVHFVDEGTDSGPIILQDTVPVEADDTAETLAARVLEVEHRLLPQAVGYFCSGRLRVEGRKVRLLQ